MWLGREQKDTIERISGLTVADWILSRLSCCTQQPAPNIVTSSALPAGIGYVRPATLLWPGENPRQGAGGGGGVCCQNWRGV